jgi:hypothetical protein
VAVGLLVAGNRFFIDGEDRVAGGMLMCLAGMAFMWGMLRR